MTARQPRISPSHPAAPTPSHVPAVEAPVLPEREAAEVKRRYASFCQELNPSGELGLVLVFRAATLAVRMERCVQHESAVLADRVRRALAEFVPPEGVAPAEAARLREEAGTRAVFDPSKGAAEARRYEAAAERGFFRALKELRVVEAERAPDPDLATEMTGEPLGSSWESEMTDAEFDAMCAERPMPGRPSAPVSDPKPGSGRADVPIAIGRRR